MTFMELEDTSAADCQTAMGINNNDFEDAMLMACTAMGINNNDFEDAMLMACAARETMDYIVTRNIAHFKSSSVPVVTPADFVKLLNRSNGT